MIDVVKVTAPMLLVTISSTSSSRHEGMMYLWAHNCCEGTRPQATVAGGRESGGTHE